MISLKVCSYVMAFTLSLSKVLPSVNLDLVSACAHVDDVLETLRDTRTNAENEFQSLFPSASELIAKVGEEVKLSRGANREGRGVLSGNDAVTPESFYRVTLIIPFIDHVTVDLTERFTKHRTLILALEKLLPSEVVNVQLDEVLPCVEFYRKILPPIENFAAKLKNWQSKWRVVSSATADRPKSAMDTLDKCTKDFYPIMNIIIAILATLPVSTATPERTFSTLRRLKTYLRNSTTESRLVGLSLITVHREIAQEPREVVRRFNLLKPRRLSLQ